MFSTPAATAAICSISGILPGVMCAATTMIVGARSTLRRSPSSCSAVTAELHQRQPRHCCAEFVATRTFEHDESPRPQPAVIRRPARRRA
jgi:hypothetical protein